MKIIEAVPHVPEADNFELRASMANLRQAVSARRWVVILTTIVTTALVIAYIWIWPPTFEVTVLVAADSDKDVQRNTFYEGWNVFRREGLPDEGALMTSAPVLKETIRRLDLKYEDVYHPFTSYVAHLWGESWIGQRYRSVKYFFFPKKPSKYELSPEEIEAFKVFSDLRDGVKIEQVKDANMGRLVVKASSARAAEIANTIVNIYLDERRKRHVLEAQQSHDSLQIEVQRTQAEAEKLDAEISRYRRANELTLQFEREKVQVGQYQGQILAVADLKAHITEKEGALRSIDRSLAAEGEVMGSARVFKDAAAQDRLVKLEAQLAQAKQLFQPGAPEITEVEEQIRLAMANVEGKNGPTVVRNASRVGESYEQLKARKAVLESQLAGDRAALASKQAELETMRLQLEKLPEKIRVSHDLERLQVFTEQKLRALHDKLAVATVSLATARSAPPALRVVEYAPPPDKPIWPQVKILLPSAIATGLVLGVLAALVLELVFLRVNRFRLWERNSLYRPFAVVDNDDKFLAALYSPVPAPRLSGPAP